MAKKQDGFFKQVRKEYRKITWPTKKTAGEYSRVIIVVCILTGLFIRLLDLLFSGLIGHIL